jgi:hypothetical protein
MRDGWGDLPIANLLSVFVITPISVSRLLASPVAQDRDQDRDRGRDDSAYRNNRYYKQGWEDGGYAHGDRDEKWQGAPVATTTITQVGAPHIRGPALHRNLRRKTTF